MKQRAKPLMHDFVIQVHASIACRAAALGSIALLHRKSGSDSTHYLHALAHVYTGASPIQGHWAKLLGHRWEEKDEKDPSAHLETCPKGSTSSSSWYSPIRSTCWYLTKKYADPPLEELASRGCFFVRLYKHVRGASVSWPMPGQRPSHASTQTQTHFSQALGGVSC